jgi:dihydroorotase
VDLVGDLLLENGIVKAVGGKIAPPEGARELDATGMVVCPGFIDLHCHLREPGFEYKETIATGTAAAARGGFTTVCAMPNTEPTMDTRATIEFVLEKARQEGAVRVLPIGCVTKGSKGKELAEMGELAQAGAIAFSDDGHPVADPNIMRQALGYSSGLGLPVINHCEVPELSNGGSMNEGWVSNRLGVKGVPASAESVMVARDISLAELTGGRLHLAHVSTAESVDLVRRAKDKGLDVTCEVTPHHLTLSDEAVLGNMGGGTAFEPLTPTAYDTHAKVNPPLRGRSDVEAMVQALREGVIDVVATDHAPHSRVEKLTTLDEADFGISVLETALGSLMSLVHAGGIELPLLIHKMTAAPAHFLGRDELGTLREGAAADVTIIDPDAEWTVDAGSFASKGKNTPLDGATLKGRVVATIVAGDVVYETAGAGE